MDFEIVGLGLADGFADFVVARVDLGGVEGASPRTTLTTGCKLDENMKNG